MWMESTSVFVSGPLNRFGIRVAIEIDIISVSGSKLNCIIAGSNLIGFSVRNEILLILESGSKLT